MCGPTVYSDSHLGHAKTYIQFDTVRRLMRDYFRYDVTLVMNITDIDDKIINRAIAEKRPFTEVARKYETEFIEDLEALNVENPSIMTRVTEYVPEVVAFIGRIVDNGYAYESNGSVYFDTKKFREAENHTYRKLKPVGTKDEEVEEEDDQEAL